MSTDERAYCLECCQNDDPRTRRAIRAINWNPLFKYQRSPPPSRVFWQVAAHLLRLSVPENWKIAGVVPHEGRVYINPTNSTNIGDVSNMLYYGLVKKTKEKRSLLSWWWFSCASWVSVCHPSAVVLYCRLIALAHSARSFALCLVDTKFQSVHLLPRKKKQSAPRSLRCWSEKQIFSIRESSIRLFPARRRRVALLLCRRSQPPAGAVSPRKPRLRRSVARDGACRRARASRLSNAAPPLLPKKTRES